LPKSQYLYSFLKTPYIKDYAVIRKAHRSSSLSMNLRDWLKTWTNLKKNRAEIISIHSGRIEIFYRLFSFILLWLSHFIFHYDILTTIPKNKKFGVSRKSWYNWWARKDSNFRPRDYESVLSVWFSLIKLALFL